MRDLEEPQELEMKQAISELNLESNGTVSKRYTVGNKVEFSREPPVNITIHHRNLDQSSNEAIPTFDDTMEPSFYSCDFEDKSGGSSLLDQQKLESGVLSRPPRPGLNLSTRPLLHNTLPNPSLMSPSEEDVPHFLSSRRRSKYELPEIVETPEEEDKGIRMFLQRRQSVDCKVGQVRYR